MLIVEEKYLYYLKFGEVTPLRGGGGSKASWWAILR